MRAAVIMLTLFASGVANAQSAPFCAISAAGRDCYYYDLPSCQERAAAMRGACVANGQRENEGGWFNNATRSYESGRRESGTSPMPPVNAGVSPDAVRQFCRDLQAQDIAELDRMIEQNSPEYERLLAQWWSRSDRCFALAR